MPLDLPQWGREAKSSKASDPALSAPLFLCGRNNEGPRFLAILEVKKAVRYLLPGTLQMGLYFQLLIGVAGALDFSIYIFHAHWDCKSVETALRGMADGEFGGESESAD